MVFELGYRYHCGGGSLRRLSKKHTSREGMSFAALSFPHLLPTSGLLSMLVMRWDGDPLSLLPSSHFYERMAWLSPCRPPLIFSVDQHVELTTQLRRVQRTDRTCSYKTFHFHQLILGARLINT